MRLILFVFFFYSCGYEASYLYDFLFSFNIPCVYSCVSVVYASVCYASNTYASDSYASFSFVPRVLAFDRKPAKMTGK